jgi:hypothetical protein
MTRKLSVIAPGKICKALPQLVRNALSRNNIDVAHCVKWRLVVSHPLI